ncbi:hypothetical protein P6P90_04780 [Ectobacillus antri]|uniref:Uncharacterized protein n=1 Tax=Ectobacillus antri TaxID=2486280 RepID=A0ABT6H2T4_9BACI|nr:hypothetical protein [Ectobacillus antri]MDG4655552.1 hypothetical protein [Ectobacillus antri]MDG5753310.1 hypothetical protein [Ectobacillus antri]
MQATVYQIGKLTITVVRKNEPSPEALQDLNRTLERLFDEQERKRNQKMKKRYSSLMRSSVFFCLDHNVFKYYGNT